MDMLLDLINSLELNKSILLQFFIFLIGYTCLYYLLFKPYNKAAQARYEKTTGSEDSYLKFEEEIELLKRQYGDKAKETNLAVKDIFKNYDQKTKDEAAELMSSAQATYLENKKAKELEIQNDLEKEKVKIPALATELKETLKKVLMGAN